MKYLTHMLAIGVSFYSFQAIASDDGLFMDALLRLGDKQLVSYWEHPYSGLENKRFIENKNYQEDSKIYSKSLVYPKVPRVHAYDHIPQDTYVSVELPREFLEEIPQHLFKKVFRDTPKENISLFFIAQNSYENEILFRPHYFTDPNIETEHYNNESFVSVGIFPLDDQKITLDGQLDGYLLNASVQTHPDGDGDIVASPNNLTIKGFDAAKGAMFCSITLVNSDKPHERKAALTYHYIAGENDKLKDNIKNIHKVGDLINSFPFLDEQEKIENILEKYASSLVDPVYYEGSLPQDFNPRLYIQLHPALIVDSNGSGMDAINYSKWQYGTYGYNHDLNYLPIGFNPALYLQLHPGVLEEAKQKNLDPVAYAKWQYAFYGYKGLNYLPYAFNPELYLQLHPGVLEEAKQKNMDPTEYAKWQYAFYGYKGLDYLPYAFNPELYLQLNPGVLEEAKQKGQKPVEYAKWQYAFYGYKNLNYLPVDFDANVYLEVNPGVLEEAKQKNMDPAEYAKWQYAFWGYTFLPYKK